MSLFRLIVKFDRSRVGRHQGILHFDCTTCYVPLKTLAVGTLCKLCAVEPDVATLAMHLSLAPALLQLVYSDASTVYLKVCVAWSPQALAPFQEMQSITSVFVGHLVTVNFRISIISLAR